MLLGRRHREEDRLRRARVRADRRESSRRSLASAPGSLPSTRQRRAPRPSPPQLQPATPARRSTDDRQRPVRAARPTGRSWCAAAGRRGATALQDFGPPRRREASAPDETRPLARAPRAAATSPTPSRRRPATRRSPRTMRPGPLPATVWAADGIRCRALRLRGPGHPRHQLRRPAGGRVPRARRRARLERRQAATPAAALRRQRFPLRSQRQALLALFAARPLQCRRATRDRPRRSSAGAASPGSVRSRGSTGRAPSSSARTDRATSDRSVRSITSAVHAGSRAESSTTDAVAGTRSGRFRAKCSISRCSSSLAPSGSPAGAIATTSSADRRSTLMSVSAVASPSGQV